MLALIDGKVLGDAVLKGRVRIIPAGFEFGQRQGVGPVAIHLVGRHVDERRFGTRPPRGLQQVQRAQRVDFEIEKRDRRGAIVRGLGGGVNDQIGPQFLHESQNAFAIADIDRRVAVVRESRDCSCPSTQLVSPSGPKKTARWLLSIPVTQNPWRAKERDTSDPIRPQEPVTRTVGLLLLIGTPFRKNRDDRKDRDDTCSCHIVKPTNQYSFRKAAFEFSAVVCGRKKATSGADRRKRLQ